MKKLLIAALLFAAPAYAEDAAKPAETPAAPTQPDFSKTPLFPVTITFPVSKATITIDAEGKVTGDVAKARAELKTMTGQPSIEAAMIAYILGQQKK